ncbi:hypothetical protein PISMIDRAFT_453437 [Pisolithus microcarpus 441]|uniref:Uncharacterized protein n=1 Tax=Pisolithus microcarpus 441 TaxID=765257 RepID=A0A0C9YWR7_9AGAM|nr:hypothetical protein BKA83DRAFT_453437 [Pisolithus microcarpus]KIK12343.1 hypothetical protein PISMIDRAFT_453437 [Pisolithus microcarpus 441]
MARCDTRTSMSAAWKCTSVIIIDLPGLDAYKVMPDSHLIVALIANKNNRSWYTINSRTSSFMEVQNLLKGRGIDLDHKRFLILQGEVESIAQMKPKAQNEHEDGLLEYLEDIVGIEKLGFDLHELKTSMLQNFISSATSRFIRQIRSSDVAEVWAGT